MRAAMLVLVSVLSLAGCVKPYQLKDVAASARLRISNQSITGMMFVGAFRVAEDCSGGKLRFDPGYINPGEAMDVRVDAGQQLSLYLSHQTFTTGEIRYANVPVTFDSRRNGFHELIFSDLGESYRVSMTVQDAGQMVIDPSFRVREWETPLLETDSFCSD